jgi:histidine triad (HIT) family protein
MPQQSPTTIFDRILSGEVPCNRVYEDEFCLAFHDLHPQAPVHVLVIPKTRITNVMSANPSDSATLGAVLLGAANAARSLGLDTTGYRLVFNNGPDGGQSVDYLHCHILGGRPMGWPPG